MSVCLDIISWTRKSYRRVAHSYLVLLAADLTGVISGGRVVTATHESNWFIKRHSFPTAPVRVSRMLMIPVHFNRVTQAARENPGVTNDD